MNRRGVLGVCALSVWVSLAGCTTRVRPSKFHRWGTLRCGAPRVKMSWYQQSSNPYVRGEREKMGPLGDQV
jgi:hypothetical protein